MQLHRDRSPKRPQVPSKKPPLHLQNAFEVLVLLSPFVHPFLLLPLYILLVLPSVGRHFSFIDRNFISSRFLSPLPRRLTGATTTALATIYIPFVVDNLHHFLRSQGCSCHRW